MVDDKQSNGIKSMQTVSTIREYATANDNTYDTRVY